MVLALRNRRGGARTDRGPGGFEGASGTPPELRLDGVSVELSGRSALSAVDLEIGRGEAVALVGPSGSGKTTFLRLLNGTLRPTRGSVEVAGRRLDELTPRELRRVRAAIGVVHQDLALVPELRVLKNVLAGRLGRLSLAASLRTLVWPSRRAVAEAYEILARVGIAEKLYERTDRLSGGERQRVAVARALLQRPRALLADEPVASVDPVRARDTVSLLVEICRERGLTLVVSLHQVELARELFPRLVGLRAGRVVFDRQSSALAEPALADLYRLPGRASGGA